MDRGKDYRVEFYTRQTKELQGTLVDIIKAEDGTSIYFFQGRFPFAVEEKNMVTDPVEMQKAPAGKKASG